MKSKRKALRRRPASSKSNRSDTSEARLAKLLGYAHATGLFTGVDTPCVEWVGNSIELSKVVVYRRIGEENCKFVGVARLSEFRENTIAWRRRPAHELNRCAFILALQYAFTELACMPFEGERAKVVTL